MKHKIPLLIVVGLLLLIQGTQAGIENVDVKVLTPQDYSHIWLGISTGGYKLMAEQGTDYTYRVFVKNGMPDDSLHNLRLIPVNQSFTINSITPVMFEQIKPMEIVTSWVNITIPEGTPEGTYLVRFDVACDEFPIGVFTMESELEVVRRIKTELYVSYTILIVGILGLLIYRKNYMNKK